MRCFSLLQKFLLWECKIIAIIYTSNDEKFNFGNLVKHWAVLKFKNQFLCKEFCISISFRLLASKFLGELK